MSLAYRSKGSLNKRGLFDFEDEFGSDPLMRRYGGMDESSQALRQADLALSQVELDKAQKSLAAAQLPAKAMSEFFTSMNSAATAKAALESNAKTQAQAAQATERLSGVKSLSELNAMRAEIPFAFNDKAYSERHAATEAAFTTKELSNYQSRLNSAQTVEEIDAATADLPVEILGNPQMNTTIQNLRKAGADKVNARRASMATTAVSSAANQQAMMSAQQQYADVLDQPAVATAAVANQKQLETEQRLRMSGLDPSTYAFRTGPEGDQMGFNFEAAERDLAQAPSSEKIRQLEGSIGRLTQRKKAAADNMLLDDGQPAVWSDNDEATLGFLTSQLDSQIRGYYQPRSGGPAANSQAVDGFAAILPPETAARVNNQRAGAGSGGPVTPPQATPQSVPLTAPTAPQPTVVPSGPTPQETEAQAKLAEIDRIAADENASPADRAVAAAQRERLQQVIDQERQSKEQALQNVEASDQEKTAQWRDNLVATVTDTDWLGTPTGPKKGVDPQDYFETIKDAYSKTSSYDPYEYVSLLSRTIARPGVGGMTMKKNVDPALKEAAAEEIRRVIAESNETNRKAGSRNINWRTLVPYEVFEK